ncbi:tRNA (guanine(37)-N1)-methyltransferase 2 isoform X2 [Babesia caballi]|uniref:tRNA (Guanine(37)-N1)-methyltransferase 2 isoform X2 n=1 Tax=Babesia caballi TaxID=5871 RepID=A0AAV4LSP0_BABCB|nr:tRNA (guanine(37)-N1)-methyltransferase 2 isoform X2 [Babesia caballi]
MPFLLNGTAATMQTERTKRLREGHIPSSTPVSECRRVESVEDLETYELNEECVFVAIRPEDNAVFAERGFFRSLAKNYKKILSDASLDDCHISGDARRFVLRGISHDSPRIVCRLGYAGFQTTGTDPEYSCHISHDCAYPKIQRFIPRLLGDSHGVMVSFETVGHIAHLNLPTERLWAKDIIAKILLDKHKHIRTVVNKVKEVDNVFRTMDLELLGGDDDLVAVQHENRYTFKIDFRNVYWNSRLIQERERVSDTFYMGDVIVDMFAGVGPFAVYGAGKGCLVLANDLNPVGTQYIQINAALNKLTDLIHHYNMDAREFARTVADHKILDKRTTAFKEYTIKPESRFTFDEPAKNRH